jgi:hypothetical protein
MGENYTVGGRVYRVAKYGSSVVELCKIVDETKKYFKLANGSLISKDNGTVRGTAGNGSFRDSLDTVHYHSVDENNAKDIEHRYSLYQVSELKSRLSSASIKDLDFKDDQLTELNLTLLKALEIIRKGKKVKE